MNMTSVAKAHSVNYEALRKYVKAIRGIYPNYARGGKMDVREIGYITIFLDAFSTTNESNKTQAAVTAVDNAIKSDMKPFIR